MDMMNPLRVIVVDDRMAVRESLRTMLMLEDDIEVVGEAGDGRQAINLAGTVNPDVVLMDYEMPEVDGIEACREIKAKKLARAVIILTMHADQQARVRARSAGCDLFLEKGLDTTELIEHVRSFAQH